jgi:predicted transcriptional regulator
MSEEISNKEILHLTADIVSEYVSHNSINEYNLSELIKNVFNDLRLISSKDNIDSKTKPAVPIDKSVTYDYIICLEDGKKLQMLKRHIKVSYGMSVEQYKLKWGLPPTYPIVAPSYAKKRSEIAKEFGLGKKARKFKAQSNVG